MTGTPAKDLPARLTSLDAYRGFVMFLIMAEVLSFCDVASAVGGSAFWNFLCRHQTHVPWIGCSLHDLIQPSFSFMVGVALPFSIASRRARGQSAVRMSLHACLRAIILILLGVFLRSTHADKTNWTFEDTLTQIGLCYGFLFVLGFRPVRDQWIALSIILAGYWALFALHPVPGPDFDYSKAGVSPDWPHYLAGFSAHWNKNTNAAWAFDTWFLNLFPRAARFQFNDGGYATLSFIPTLGTMILGLIAGGVMRSERSPGARIKWLVIAGVAGLASGAVIGWFGLCPVVKRIWTPSWVLYSGGWCFLLLAGFYGVIDVRGWKRWAFPFAVIGMNSIAAYCIDHLWEDFISKNVVTHLGRNMFLIFCAPYEPLVHGAAVLLVYWLILYWMYRRRIFLRI